MRKGALEGIRVLDLGRVVAAPICGQILGDLGADVIKVERVKGGDDVRGVAPFTKDGINLYYPTFNRNKRSITIDFRNPKGIEVLRRADRQCRCAGGKLPSRNHGKHGTRL